MVSIEDKTTSNEVKAAEAKAAADAHAEEAEASRRKSVVLRVEAPFWTTSFQFGTVDDGNIVIITSQGVEVLASEAKDIIEAAALHGVAIVEVSI